MTKFIKVTGVKSYPSVSMKDSPISGMLINADEISRIQSLPESGRCLITLKPSAFYSEENLRITYYDIISDQSFEEITNQLI